jgi:hypothetical protein
MRGLGTFDREYQTRQHPRLCTCKQCKAKASKAKISRFKHLKSTFLTRNAG